MNPTVRIEESATMLDQAALSDTAPEDCVGEGASLRDDADVPDVTEVTNPPDEGGLGVGVALGLGADGAPGTAVVPSWTAIGVAIEVSVIVAT